MPAPSESVIAEGTDNPAPAPRSRPVSSLRAREAAADDQRRAFCARLVAARERRGVSLHAMAAATKISETLFVDLEQGNLSRWPMGIYRRSFFREYAHGVGLPVDSTTSEFVRLFPEERTGGSARNLVAPGPLRLTLARSVQLPFPAVWAQAAVLDGLVITLVVGILVLGFGLPLWTTLAIAALAYFLTSTVCLGCSPATWWFQHHSGYPQGFKLFGVLLLVAACAAPALAQEGGFQPEVGQPGKDVVWVPSPPGMVELMLDMAQVTPQDFVMDLGSGDGRNVIAAARRGARGLGVEYNPDMVALSRRAAEAAGLSDRAQFVEGDMFTADVSDADVLALFLLPSNLLRLRSTFLEMRPGTRIVSNTFSIQDWPAEKTEEVGGDCTEWCTAHLYVVPAKVVGTWRAGADVVTLAQAYQMVSGTLTPEGATAPVAVTGKLAGRALTFTAGEFSFAGEVRDGRIEGTMRRGDREAPWTAAPSS